MPLNDKRTKIELLKAEFETKLSQTPLARRKISDIPFCYDDYDWSNSAVAVRFIDTSLYSAELFGLDKHKFVEFINMAKSGMPATVWYWDEESEWCDIAFQDYSDDYVHHDDPPLYEVHIKTLELCAPEVPLEFSVSIDKDFLQKAFDVPVMQLKSFSRILEDYLQECAKAVEPIPQNNSQSNFFDYTINLQLSDDTIARAEKYALQQHKTLQMLLADKIKNMTP